jgi:hypothetical protein
MPRPRKGDVREPEFVLPHSVLVLGSVRVHGNSLIDEPCNRVLAHLHRAIASSLGLYPTSSYY